MLGSPRLLHGCRAESPCPRRFLDASRYPPRWKRYGGIPSPGISLFILQPTDRYEPCARPYRRPISDRASPDGLDRPHPTCVRGVPRRRCAESPVHQNYKNAIVDARETDRLVLNKKSTPCIRALKSERDPGDLRGRADGAGRAEGHPQPLFPWRYGTAPALAGQSAGLIDAVKPAQQIIEETVAQFFAITGRLGGLAGARSFGGGSGGRSYIQRPVH